MGSIFTPAIGMTASKKQNAWFYFSYQSRDALPMAAGE
jgi:hypothetical protein